MNIETRAAIRPVKVQAEDDLISRPGVNMVDIAEKVTDGKPTGELAIVVYVDQKLPASRLSKSNAIPSEINGIKTDVQEMRIVLQPAWQVLDAAALVDKTKYSTLVGGVSMGPSRSFYLTPPEVETPGNYVMVGTLGALVSDNGTGDVMALSNFHVAAVDNTWSTSDRQVQPGRPDGGVVPADEFGTLTRAVLSTNVDGSVTRVDAGKTWSAEIQGIGDVNGTATATVGMAVRKRGRTTELTYGSVVSVDATVSIPYGDGLGTRTLKHQIRIATDTTKSTRFSDHGDSGSVVVDNDRNVVGLLFAGSDDGSATFANPVAAVLSELNVTLLVKPPVVQVPPSTLLCPSKAVICQFPSKTIICNQRTRTIVCQLPSKAICPTGLRCPTAGACPTIACASIACASIACASLACASAGCPGPGLPGHGPMIRGAEERVDYGYGEAEGYDVGFEAGYAAAKAESEAAAPEGVPAAIPSLVTCPSVIYCPPSRINCPTLTCPSRACPSVLYCPSLRCPTRVGCPSLPCPTMACTILAVCKPSLACPTLQCPVNPGDLEPGTYGSAADGDVDASYWAGYLAALEQLGGDQS